MTHTATEIPGTQYLTAVERAGEMARLQAQAAKRKSMLVFGPEGVGKTRLLRAFAGAEAFALYVPQVRNPKEMMQSLAEGLRGWKKNALRLPEHAEKLSTPALKGVVRRALAEQPFVLVLDQVAGPSRVVTGVIKEFSDYGQRPVIFAARSHHMEDIGALRPMCADRSERLELKNFAPAVALEFARREAERLGLQAENLDATLDSVAGWSEGNPGGILRMLKMATLPGYRVDHQIKAHVLYLDFLMGKR
jgi:hypothetical protein